MTIQEILEKWLDENGYDGLCNVDLECGCWIGDLMPCDCPSCDCEAGHKAVATEGEWKGCDVIYSGRKDDQFGVFVE